MISPVLQLQQDSVYALAQSGSRLYAARASGLYRSLDGGLTWENTFRSLEVPPPLAAAAVSAADDTVFAGVKGAVLRSNDAGASWQIVGLASPPPLVVALALSPNYPADGLIAAATADAGVFISTDRGETWVAWNFGLVDHHIYSLTFSPDFAHDQTLWVGTESGIFRSHNSGKAWRDLPFPMDAAPVLSLHAAPSGVIYAGTEQNGLWRSADRGTTWQRIPADPPLAAVNAIGTHAPDAIWLLLEDRLLVSADAGQSWDTVYTLPPDKAALAALWNDAALIGCADGDVLSVR